MLEGMTYRTPVDSPESNKMPPCNKKKSTLVKGGELTKFSLIQTNQDNTSIKKP
jgi:hypothetical protein